MIIGVDPHKRSATIEVVDEPERVLATGRFGTDRRGYRRCSRCGRRWPERVWAVEGSNGAGRPLAQRLLADGENVVDVPAKLAARARLFDTGHNRKTDAGRRARGRGGRGAHPDLLAGPRRRRAGGAADAGRPPRRAGRAAGPDRQPAAPAAAELVPGGAKKDLSAPQAKAMLATVRPRDLVGQDPPAAGRRADRRAGRGSTQDQGRRSKELDAVVAETGSGLMDLPGVGPVVAARILADVGDVARFADRNRFASWTGTAPLDASSGEQIRHRLSRAGNRRMNHVIHIAAIVQIRHDTDGRAYYRRKLAAGKTPMEALRCLKRRISDAVYRQLVADDAQPDARTGPGGHWGATLQSSAAGPTPTPALRISHFPDPPNTDATTVPILALDTEGSHYRPSRAPSTARRVAGVPVTRRRCRSSANCGVERY